MILTALIARSKLALTSLRRLVAVLASLVVLVALVPNAALFGCSAEPPPRETVEHFLLLDGSSSRSQESLEQWARRAEEVIAALGPGDRVVLYGIHDQTATAPPLFEGELPAQGPQGLNQDLQFQGARRKLRDEARAKVVEFLARTPARQTDLFAVFDRLPPVTRSRRILWFLSDMRHSTRELDLERLPLTPERARALATDVVRRRRLDAELLRSTELRCHLDVPGAHLTPSSKNSVKTASHPKPSLTSRPALQAFWSTFAEALGGKLTHFDNAAFRQVVAPPSPSAPAAASTSPPSEELSARWKSALTALRGEP